tara:strand:+ start:183 stop:452 length:270 start_codon:yes stop_codon:yes gene_type:complete
MGSKHNKKRFLIVKYSINKEGKYDELIELSKKKLGPGKIANGGIILDLINKEVIKCDMPGVAETQILSYTKIYDYFRKYYAEAIDQFIK